MNTKLKIYLSVLLKDINRAQLALYAKQFPHWSYEENKPINNFSNEEIKVFLQVVDEVCPQHSMFARTILTFS